MIRHLAIALAAVSVSSLALAQEEEGPAQGPGSEELGATVDVFTQADGETHYLTACSGCHGRSGGGAYGAAQYPALAGNARLEVARYPVNLIVEGNGAMPSFAEWLDDEQVAAVTNYIRSELGNGYADAVSSDDVARMREDFAKLDEG